MSSTQEDEKEEKADHPTKGIVYVCTAFFLFTAMQAFNKLLVGQHNVIEVAFYRNVLSLIPCVLIVVLQGKYFLLKSDMPWAMTGRVVIGTTGLLLTFAATQELPLANATVLFFTSTLMLPVLARFFLNEHIAAHRWVAIIVGMCGVLLVAQPSAEMTAVGIFLALGAAVFHASIQVILRIMRNENPFTITLYFFLGGALLSGVLMPFAANAPTKESAPLLLAIGITGGLGQYFLTRAFQMASASLLSPFNYTGLLWAMVFDILFWNYIPHWPVWIGGAIIVSSHFFLIQRERHTRKKLLQQLGSPS